MVTHRVGTGVELHVETFDGGSDTILLIMGLGAQMLLWPDAFCQQLAELGYRVVRFDNRDVGLSSRLSHLPTPSAPQLLLGWASGRPPTPPYTMMDLADDAAALLDVLGTERAHVVGASMGGMIAQQLAISHPQRVASLVSVMSTPWAPLGGLPSTRAIGALLARPGPTREEAIAHTIATFRAIGSPVLPPDEEALRDIAERSFDRGLAGRGFFRQLAAVLDAPDRRPALAQLRVPALVMHGAHDPLIRVQGGLETARAIPSAEWLLFEPMGHDLPQPLWPAMVGAIHRTIRRAL